MNLYWFERFKCLERTDIPIQCVSLLYRKIGIYSQNYNAHDYSLVGGKNY